MTVPGLGTHSSDHVHRLRRSKGCAVCLKRRVKCDEKSPSCTQCQRGGRKCYGILSSIFLHVELASLSGPANRITRDNIKQAVDCAPEPTIELTWAEPVFGPMDGESDQEKSPKAIAPREPRTRIIDSNAEASKESQNICNSAMEANNIPSIIQQHLSNFVHLYTIIMPRNMLSDTWIDRLPNMLSPTNDPLMGMCITAVSLLYCGLFSNNDSITAESYRWYGTALTRQRSKIKELDNSSKKPTVEEICAPIILSFFEVASGNSHAAQFHHLQGAARLLERHGPTECSEGLLFGLFQTLRLLMIYPTVKIQHELVFGTEEWRTIPFLRYPRSHIGRIIDIASATSGLLSRVESLITRPTQVREAETLEIKREALDLEEKLNRIWDELWKSNQRPESDSDAVDDIQSADFASPEVLRIPSETPPALLSTLSNLLPDNTSPSVPVAHQSPFPSEQNNDNLVNIEHLRCLAFYSAARMLVLSILHSVNAAPASYEEQTQGHCARILNAASTMSEVHVGYVYLRLLLPLRVVAIFGTFEQREKAGEISPKNGLRKGFSGNADGNNIRGTKSG